MIEIGELKQRLDESDWVVFDPEGETRDLLVPSDVGPATILVSEVTDALKRIVGDHLVAGSVDRGLIWAVEGFLLNRVVVEALEDGSLGLEELLETVPRSGFSWQVMIRSA